MMESKKLYWRMYLDRTETDGKSAILSEQEMLVEANWYFEARDDEQLPPVFEPIMMTEKEFLIQPWFLGF